MLRAFVTASVLLGCSYGPALAQCGVQPWGIPYLGSNTSTSMSVGSGQPCQVYVNVGGTNIITSVAVTAHPSHGTASARDDIVTYRSRPGFTGQDSFTFSLSGSGPGGSGTSSVQVSVSVQ
ncbi:Ig-like domain-containing protein [Pseudorhodoplanes sp.]|uniref:Ig-like domain-containing protein n=1 Tax=Pseudorhodoplanes sp. TaxID=1934341 RepID=UPI00391AF050